MLGAPFLYAIGLQAYVIAFPLFMLSLLSGTVLSGGDAAGAGDGVNDEDVVTNASLRLLPRLGTGALLLVFLGAAGVLHHVHAAERQTARLAQRFLSGEQVLVPGKKGVYAAQAVRAFNSLRSATRQSLVAAMVQQDGRSTGCAFEKTAAKDASFEVMHLRRVGNDLFVFLALKQALRTANIPISARFADDGAPRENPRTDFLMMLPPAIGSGVWLFAVPVSDALVELGVGCPTTGRPQSYYEPIQELAYRIRFAR